MKNCFAFNKKNNSYPLIDERGCSTDGIMSRFIPSADGQSATSMISSMFKFPEGAEVQIQCDIIECSGKCVEEEKCNGESLSFVKGGRALGQAEEGLLLAATTVFVLDPSDLPTLSPICDATGIRPHWLLWLTIVLGVLFLIMLLMNLFLCTAMSCSCARTEVSLLVYAGNSKKKFFLKFKNFFPFDIFLAFKFFFGLKCFSFNFFLPLKTFFSFNNFFHKIFFSPSLRLSRRSHQSSKNTILTDHGTGPNTDLGIPCTTAMETE